MTAISLSELIQFFLLKCGVCNAFESPRPNRKSCSIIVQSFNFTCPCLLSWEPVQKTFQIWRLIDRIQKLHRQEKVSVHFDGWRVKGTYKLSRRSIWISTGKLQTLRYSQSDMYAHWPLEQTLLRRTNCHELWRLSNKVSENCTC